MSDLFEDQQSTPITGFFGTYRFLSNFWMASVSLDGVVYPSVENAYQAAKTLPHLRMVFAQCSPSQAKQMGRTVSIRIDWNAIKIEVMRDLVNQKFSPQSKLAKSLMETGNCDLIEENTWGDTFWGRCNGKGHNHLGRLLMEQRARLLCASQTQQP